VSETHSFENVIYQKDGPIARVIMNRPHAANAHSETMVREIDDALKLAQRDYDVKVLVIKANGKGFSAGHDVNMRPGSHPEFEASLANIGVPWKAHQDLYLWPVLSLWEFPKPVIAQVHGYCIGGGTYYGLFTDITIASDDAYFQMPLLQGHGLPGGETMIEPWIFMNWKRASEYMYTAQTLTAEQALEMGLVNRVVPRADLEQTVEDMAAEIARVPLSTLMATKALMKRAWELMGLRMHMQMSTDLMTMAIASSDAFVQVRASGKRSNTTLGADEVGNAGQR
jgi:enoyl-CoA hydratase